MPIFDDETPLMGGNVNPKVVRVADTVRRSTGPCSKNVHRLLVHLERQGFGFAPRFLGIDERGREILSFIPGSAEIPDALWQDATALVEAARMLKKFHDATRDFDFGHAGDWAYAYPLGEQNDVICHNDFAPYNMIFRDNLPIGIVDFDLAGPGPRMRDLAYLAYWFAPLSFSSKELAERSVSEVASGNRRLKLLCATYGTSDYAGLLDMLFEVLDHMSSESTVMKMIGREAATKLGQGGHFERWKREAIAFDKNRSAIWRNLG
jgi:hypothetical protein